ncbi:MAG: isoprenylcysteine carboxylmethyltransferase family protein [Solirubrobacterales bacterium]|nr:isoprenylcysteine carboxylmethyltransferase family protein [Solirubrobacterales bacterium]
MSAAPCSAKLGGALFLLAGPGLEAGVGPWLLTGLDTGDGLPGPWALRAAGGVLIAAGLIVLADAFVRLAREGLGTPSPAAPPSVLVATGAYRHVRHPMYAATTAVIAGEALLLREPVLLLGAAMYVATLCALVRFREDPLLRRRFGAAHDEYRAAIPGWWPRLRLRR